MILSPPTKPSLFGLEHSNREFSIRESWGKNQFNNSFPAALACYMHSKNLKPVYLKLLSDLTIGYDYIGVTTIFGLEPSSPNLFFCFESEYVPYRKLVVGKLPRVDLVLQNSQGDYCLNRLEIKLTALPDNSTCQLPDNQYGCEIVIRPDTIVYLSLSIAENFQDSRENLLSYLEPVCHDIRDWSQIDSILPRIPRFVDCIDRLISENINAQKPLVMQPVWKTIGKTSKLYENCLDIFIWSNYSFTRLFFDATLNFIRDKKGNIERPMRSVIWLTKMLYDFALNGKVNHKHIIDSLTYGTKNDKAFALSGNRTRQYMSCSELIQPRVTKSEIKSIILGGGQNFLSPERRLDGVILSNPEIFDPI